MGHSPCWTRQVQSEPAEGGARTRIQTVSSRAVVPILQQIRDCNRVWLLDSRLPTFLKRVSRLRNASGREASQTLVIRPSMHLSTHPPIHSSLLLCLPHCRVQQRLALSLALNLQMADLSFMIGLNFLFLRVGIMSGSPWCPHQMALADQIVATGALLCPVHSPPRAP